MQKQLISLCALLAAGACSKQPKIEHVPIFVDRAGHSGIEFWHEPGDAGENYLPEVASGGLALLDFDLDGDLDILFIQSTFLGRDVGQAPPSKLYENRQGADGLHFVDVTPGSGLGRLGYGMGAAVGDYDNDGDPDLYVTAFGSNYLFRNDGHGQFTDVTGLTKVDDSRWSSSAAFFDYDNDDDLDLFVSNYVSFSISHNKHCSTPTGARDYCGPSSYESVPDRLFRNNGGGPFSDISQATQLDRAYGPGLGVLVADFNSDGALDLYVANDGEANQLWEQTKETWANTGLIKGASHNAQGMTEASMGIAAGDFDNDGDEDLFMTHLRNETNTLYENFGATGFIDSTQRVSLAAASRAYTGFGTAWLDYDNDGWLDLFVANGAVALVPDQPGPFAYREPNQLFQNRAGRFVEVSQAAGPAVTAEWVSRGAAVGDIDNDGDTDIVVVNANGPAQLLINQVGQDASWVGVDLRPGGTPGYHARVAVAGDSNVQWRTARREGSYQSASDPRVLFGLGAHAGTVDILVAWRNRTAEVWLQRDQGQYHALRPGDGIVLTEFCARSEHPFCR